MNVSDEGREGEGNGERERWVGQNNVFEGQIASSRDVFAGNVEKVYNTTNNVERACVRDGRAQYNVLQRKVSRRGSPRPHS